LVPDADLVVLQPAHIGVALQEPEQFDDDRAQVQLLGGEQRKALRKIEAHLVAEDRAGADAGAVLLLDALVEDQLEQVEIGLHGRILWPVARRRATRFPPKWMPKRSRL